MASPNTLKIRNIGLVQKHDRAANVLVKSYKQGTIIHSGGIRYGSFPKKASSKISTNSKIEVTNNKETDSNNFTKYYNDSIT